MERSAVQHVHAVAAVAAVLKETTLSWLPLIDSGVEVTHGGVGAAVWVNAGEVAGDGIDNDGNGEKVEPCD